MVATEIGNSCYGIIFDFATYKKAEFIAAMVNFVRVTPTGRLRRSLLLLRLAQYGASVEHKTLSGMIVDTLQQTTLSTSLLDSSTHDTAGVNQAAGKVLMDLYPQMDAFNCMSHVVNK